MHRFAVDQKVRARRLMMAVTAVVVAMQGLFWVIYR
jgi:hypothetical protein